MTDEERLIDSLRRARRRQRDRARRAAERAAHTKSGVAAALAMAADAEPTGACFLRFANGVKACRNGLTEPVCIEAASDAGAAHTWREGKECP